MKFRAVLRGSSIPRSWYNIVPDLPFKLPPLINSRTGYPVGPHDLEPFLTHELIDQEMGVQREVGIPPAVREVFRGWRPTPLVRARGLEQALGTPAMLFYKYEGRNPYGTHEANTAFPQAFYAARNRMKRLVTGTASAGWGAALATACRRFGVECKVYLVREAAQHNPRIRTLMELAGAQVVLSPSNETRVGRKALSQDPNHPGTLGLAISEAVEEAMEGQRTKCALPTVLNHVVLHQTIIGLEARGQLEREGLYPDLVVGSAGGGTGFAGLAVPFLRDRLRDRPVRFLVVEPSAAPSLTRGVYAYDYADAVGLFPLLKMYTLGHSYAPPSAMEATGMGYHGMSPIVSALVQRGVVEARALGQREALQAAVQFAQHEGVTVGPEAAFTLKGVVDEALACKEKGEKRVILFSVNYLGYLSLQAYEALSRGELQDASLDEEALRKALSELPQVKEGS